MRWRRSDNDDIITGSVNSQHSTRTRGIQGDVNNNNNNNNNNLTLSDIATLLRGSATILENNAPRLNNIVNQAGQQG